MQYTPAVQLKSRMIWRGNPGRPQRIWLECAYRHTTTFFLTYRTDSTDSLPIQRFYSAQRLDLFVQCVRLNRLSVGFGTHSESLQFFIFIHFIFSLCLRYRDAITAALHVDRSFVPIVGHASSTCLYSAAGCNLQVRKHILFFLFFFFKWLVKVTQGHQQNY